MLRSTGKSRGTGPRPTVLCSLRSPDRKRPRDAQHAPFTVGEGLSLATQRSRGTGPRPTGPETIAGDRPPRYGIQNGSFYRRARACPSPGCGLPRDRGGQAPALRAQNDYFCRFTAPNVVNIRLDAETGPRNIRVAKVSGLPSNATSSI